MNGYKAGLKSSFFSGSWLMLFILSAIPAIFLLWDWDPDGELKSLKKTEDQAWLAETDSIAERFREASDHQYWIKLFGLKIKSLFRASLNSGKSTEKSLSILPKAFRFSKAPDILLWGFQYKRDGTMKMLSGEGFQRDKKYFLEKLFTDIASLEIGKKSGLGFSNWDQRLKVLFGKMIHENLFYKKFTATPFPVIYNGKSYLMLWECLKEPETNAICGAYLLLQPFGDKDRLLALELTLANWNAIRDGSSSAPAFVPLTMSGFKKIVFHESLKEEKELQKNIKSFLVKNFLWTKSNGYDEAGSVKLPGAFVGLVKNIGEFRLRICVLSNLCGHMGILIDKRPPQLPSFRIQVSKGYIFFTGCFWILFLVNRYIFGRSKSFSLKIRLSFWFLAFCAVPVGLSLGTWSALLQGFKQGRVRSLQGELEKHLSDFEISSGKVQANMQRACKLLVKNEEFVKDCFDLQKDLDKDQMILGAWEDFLTKNGLETDGILAALQGGWLLKRYNSKVSFEMEKAATTILGGIIGAYLEQASPSLYKKYSPKETSLHKDKRTPGFAGFDDSKLYENAHYIRESFGRVVIFERGNDVYLHYYHPVYKNSDLFGIVLFAKNANTEYEKVLPEMLAESAVEFRKKYGISVDLVVYRKDANGLKMISKQGNVRGMVELASLSGTSIGRKYSEAGVEIAMPTVMTPGYILAIRAPDFLILQDVDKEKLLVIFSLLALILIVFTGIQGFSEWIVLPVITMQNQLKKLRAGELKPDFELNRLDEFGVVGQKLNSMANWLIERKGVARFVSPQVINGIEEKNLIKAGAGTFQNAVILVSDIRSFTTISEQESAEDVFEMVNTHLGAISEIIENHGGVIDRFVGDAVWAVFYEKEGNLPLQNSINASIYLMKEHMKIQDSRRLANKFVYKIGVGLDFGKILAGVIGDAAFRLDFSVIGEALNEAENLEGLSKISKHTGIIVSKKFKEKFSNSELKFGTIEKSELAFELLSLEEKF